MDSSASRGSTQTKGKKMQDLARRLWSSDWRPDYVSELTGYESNGMLAAAGGLLDITPASSYLLKHRSSEKAALTRLRKEVLTAVRWCAEATHLKNEHCIPFSMAGRSCAHLGHKSSCRSWSEDGNVRA